MSERRLLSREQQAERYAGWPVGCLRPAPAHVALLDPDARRPGPSDNSRHGCGGAVVAKAEARAVG